MLADLDFHVMVGLLFGAFFLLDLVVLVLVARSMIKAQDRPPAAKPERKAPQYKTGGPISYLLITLFWSAIVLVFDIGLGLGFWEQWRSQGFATAQGEVVRCEVQEKADADGTSHSVDLEYTYQVGNHTWTGNRIRFVDFWGGQDTAAQFVQAHPPGRTVTVYYDPDDPATAVLRPGLGGVEWFLMLFLLPFNVVMVGLWCAGLAYCLGGKRALHRFYYGVQFLESAEADRVRLPGTSPAMAAFLTAAFGPILPLILVAFCAGMPPPVPVLVGLWILILAGTLFVYLRVAVRVAAGKYDLVIDPHRRTLTLPQTFGRKEAVVVPLSDLQAVEVTQVKGRDQETHYAATAHWRGAGGEVKEDRLIEWDEEQDAEQLAAWVRSKVGLVSPPQGAPPVPQ